ncbi:hypothetical protein NDU88_003989 [Pleurodeles waltl]|uniref:DUF397 domain-containing protein n=1 Tax=Pleurodeles waltl TaxID=8319 RepID=A0AAV7RHU3_PLEWA|nr:hypothetical protein NDU88_003989 [Pleurodeles waltl]
MAPLLTVWARGSRSLWPRESNTAGTCAEGAWTVHAGEEVSADRYRARTSRVSDRPCLYRGGELDRAFLPRAPRPGSPK